MKKYFSAIIIIFLFAACEEVVKEPISAPSAKILAQEDEKPEFVIAIHGGAGSIREKNMSDSLQQVYEAKLSEAIKVGYAILEEGGTAVDAVRETINVMENSPLFNAGRGAVMTNKETIALDASIMNGETLNAGAVAGVTTVKNPIDLAYQVMINSPHVLLAGRGAETFAAERGLELVDPTYFYTEESRRSLQRVKAAEAAKNTDQRTGFYDATIKDPKYGTVGCVALDQDGNLAAGTSTGGMTNKKWDRIGDSPIIGAGTYANNKTCAISSTGWGEFFIRGVVAYDIAAMMEYKGISLEEAAKAVIQEKLPALGGNGGIIAVDHEGNIVMEFNTPGMFRASITSEKELEVAMFGE